MEKEQLICAIQTLKKEKDAIILAHYYTDGEIQELADYVGDSYYLSKIAKEVPQKLIVFCGVLFMGESAKILSPYKTILMPEINADCPMAHMVTPAQIEYMKEKHKDLAVVCYINSTAEIKALSDVCVTSSNALKIVRNIKAPKIFFIPDENLGRYIAVQVPEKEFLFKKGFCPVHKSMTKEALMKEKTKYPHAQILVHPECTPDVVEMGDYVGSTSGIIEYATKNPHDTYIVCTEVGIEYPLKIANPNKVFHFVGDMRVCKNMKSITLEKLYEALRDEKYEITLEETLMKKAENALIQMHKLAEN